MASRKAGRLTLEAIRAAGDALPREAMLEASARLLAALRKNAATIQEGKTPGTTKASYMQRTEGRAFWNRRRGKP
jgi:hypothetical protein